MTTTPGDIDAVVTSLYEMDDVDGIIVFGSYARQDFRPSSDLDLIIVCGPDSVRRRVRSATQSSSRVVDIRISMTFFAHEGLLREFERRPSFAAHLADEGVFLKCARSCLHVRARLEDYVPPKHGLELELRRELAALDIYRDTSRLNGHYLTSLARLYSIARSIIIIRLLQRDVHQYNWQRIFDLYAELHPSMRSSIECLASLRPYYEYLIDRRDTAPDRLHTGEKVTDAAVASVIRRISAVASTDEEIRSGGGDERDRQ